jgi:ferredoxin/flavodoxin---NADP+ reductase
MYTVRIISNIELAKNIFLLEFEKPFSFIAGQVINIHNDDFATRMYSIASGEKDPTLKILFDVKSEGHLTPILKSLKQNDKLNISEPFGSFKTNNNKAYWIAAGTGIAPFYSMFISGLANDKILIHGGSYPDNFYFQDEFSSLFTSKNYIRCITKQKSTSFFNGRVSHYLQQQTQLPSDYKYYLCGSTEMVVDTRDILIEKGVLFNNIIAEIFF